MPETYTGDEGDDALAAGFPVMDGGEDRRDGWLAINLTRDLVANVKALVAGVTRAWTTAATAALARTALGFPDLGAGNLMPPNAIAVSNAAQQLTTADPTLAAHAASKGYVDTAIAAGSTSGSSLTLSGHLYTPNNTAGGAGTVAYIQTSDGRLTRGVSARKYKKLIRKLTPASLGDLFPQFVDWEMKNEFDPSDYRSVGYIADDMIGTPLERFVAFGPDGEVEGYDVLQVLLAQVAQLHAEVVELRAQRAE